MQLDKTTGFTLIEVLIALVILSIGLLGLASLHAESLKKSNDAYLSSIASNMANDMIDRMRGNQEEAANGQYITLNNTAASNVQANCLDPLVTSGCDGAQMAQNDVNEWQTSVAATLPQGTGFICLSNNPGNLGSAINCNNLGDIYVIAITWRNRDGQTDEYRVTFKP